MMKPARATRRFLPTSPFNAPPAAPPAVQYVVQDQVTHDKYGLGRVMSIEDGSSVGPFGAKGIGEQALIPTAPAIFNAIHHATGVRIRRAPATPDRVRQAILTAAITPT